MFFRKVWNAYYYSEACLQKGVVRLASSIFLYQEKFAGTLQENIPTWLASSVGANPVARIKLLVRNGVVSEQRRYLASQRNYRENLFDCIRTNPAFERSTYRAWRKKSEAEESDENGEDVLSGIFLSSSRLREYITEPEKYSYNLDHLDKLSRNILPAQTIVGALKLADIWYQISNSSKRVPNFHRSFLLKIAKCGHLNPHEAIQALFYCAAYRRITPEVEKDIKGVVLQCYCDLSLPELEILAFSAYVLKVNFRYDTEFLNHLAQSAPTGSGDSLAGVVTILKFLRQNRFSDQAVLSRISTSLSSAPLPPNSAPECCHIMESFAAAKYYDECFMRKLELVVVENLRNQLPLYSSLNSSNLLAMHPSERLRAKDISAYVFSIAMLNIPLSDPDLVLQDLRNRLDVKEFSNASHLLIQILYGLSLLGCYDRSLVKEVLSSSTNRKLQETGWKDAQRWLYCLYKNCEVEFPEVLEDIDLDVDGLTSGLPVEFDKTGFEMAHRDKDLISVLTKSLARIYGSEAVRWKRLLPQFEISGFEIQTVSSVGLIGALKKGDLAKGHKACGAPGGIVLEILDGWTTAANDNSRPLGPTSAKIRILKKLGYSVKTVNQVDVRKWMENCDGDPVESVSSRLEQLLQRHVELRVSG